MDNIEKNNIFTVSLNDTYGRYLEAARNIKSGEIIFKDKPIVIGPKNGTEICCVACYSALTKRIYPCKRCKLAPLCGPECENLNSGGHSKAECDLYSKFQSKINVMKLIENFHLVTLIRCVLLRSTEDWDRLMMMESHVDLRRDSGIWKHHEKVVKFLVTLIEDVDEDFLQKLCGIIDVNSFELRTQAHRDESSSKVDTICGIYPTAALMAHSCIGNTHLSVDAEFIMTIRASVDIEKGSPIFFNYANPLQGTVLRKRHLREGKYFECSCRRCSDPTELGTYMSSVKCEDCNGMMVIENPHVSDPFEEVSAWKCENCKMKKSGKDILQVLETMASELKIIDAGSENEIEAFLQNSSKYLSDNHHFRIDAKQALAGLLRDSVNISVNPKKKVMQNIIKLCRDFLPVIDIIEPGLSRMKAITLYELHYPIVQIANRERDSKDITNNQLLERLLEAERYLKESIRLLLIEPSTTPEGILCKRAMTELKSLKNAIQAVGIMAENNK